MRLKKCTQESQLEQGLNRWFADVLSDCLPIWDCPPKENVSKCPETRSVHVRVTSHLAGIGIMTLVEHISLPNSYHWFLLAMTRIAP